VNRNNKIFIGILVVMAVFFAVQLIRLFLLRLDVGDTYPEYSTYRADPLGVRALYGALGSLPELSVRRNIKPIDQFDGGRDSVLFICGAKLSPDPEKVIQVIERFVANGGRLVVTLFPLDRKPSSWFEDEDEEKERGTESKPSEDNKDKAKQKDEDKSDDESKSEDKSNDDDKDKRRRGVRSVSIEKRWGFSHNYARIPGSNEDKRGAIMASKTSEISELPDTVSWHSALYFEGSKKEESGDRSQELEEMGQDAENVVSSLEPWKTIYSWNGRTVLMERPWGNGTIVLCSDSYFLSNEAMRNERHPELLAWLVGSASDVIFDETHLGIQENTGTMSLMRKYRLGGVIASLCLLGVLFIWMSAVSLTPKRDMAEETRASITEGRDAAAGLENLLRRNIPSKKILAVCFEEWQRTQAGLSAREVSPDKRLLIQDIVDRENAAPLRERNPVRAYRKICGIVLESRLRGNDNQKKRPGVSVGKGV